ncbi:hypothetical protein SAMN04515674_105299 [Pseudarcicella hirudinis]|uniref:Uncharacterized protein n=1 Tax=Pseudarcicella hirudinis TaxID=1079859 RepID=A0A1I5SZT4_9BACT|nr:hypothetical protein [Pseudarcicella hirudinis]SFP76285.1 hypothetical protein SAMN04515674_105299 [Pseudarcicella hirudinis]
MKKPINFFLESIDKEIMIKKEDNAFVPILIKDLCHARELHQSQKAEKPVIFLSCEEFEEIKERLKCDLRKIKP